MNDTRNNAGFTLIELMIAVVIIGILASVAYPSYIDYVRKSKLGEATSTLATMRVKAEQYFADNRTYVGMEANCATWAGSTQYFGFSCGTPTASAYTFTANGSATDVLGFTYTINQNNTRSTTIAAPAPTAWRTGGAMACWITEKGQTC